MASIPILAAVASVIVIPVVGTGIYYSVKPSREETTNQQQERTPKLPEKRPHTPSSQIKDIAEQYGARPGGTVNIPGNIESSKAMSNLIKDAQKQREEAFADLNDTLGTGNIGRPFNHVNQTSGYAGSYSSSATRLNR